MNKKNFIFIALAFILVFSLMQVNATNFLCYQENATNSTICGGLATGAYFTQWMDDPTRSYDGSWTSYGDQNAYSSGNIDMVFTNYSKPTGASQANSRWQVKTYNFTNETIPLACWNQEPIRLIMGAWKNQGPANVGQYGRCYNGSTWITIMNYTDCTPSGSACGKMYEEAMFWQIDSINVTLVSPASGAKLVYGTNSFVCNASSTKGLTNSTFYLWNSTNNLIYSSMQPITLNPLTYEKTTAYAITNIDTYHWNCKFWNNLSDSTMASSNFTATLPSSSINITLSSPANATQINNANKTFFCNATSNHAITNSTLYIWNSLGNLVGSSLMNELSLKSIYYQETANSIIVSGDYGIETYDGNWLTSDSNGPPHTSYFYANYTKPAGYTGATWMISEDSGHGTPVIENISIPEDCFDESVLQVRVKAMHPYDGNPSQRNYCWDGTTWFDIGYNKTTMELVEEGIWWGYPSNFSQTFVLPYEDTFDWDCKIYDIFGSYNWGSLGSYKLTYQPNITIVNETYSTNVLELSNYNFTETIQKSDNLTEITPTFYYNGTAYTTGITNTTNGENITYSKTLNIPYITQTDLYLNKTSYWSFNISYGGHSHLQNSTTKQHINHKMALNNLSSCTGDYALSFYTLIYKDEILETALTGINNTWNYELFNPENSSITRNFNGSIALTTHKWCDHYSTPDHYFKVRSLTSEVERTNYTTRKDMVCEIANTTSISQTQYLMSNTTDYQKFYFNIKDKYQANFPNAYVYFYKWQSNQWLYLGSELTDVYGNIVMRLVEDKKYKLIIKDDECGTIKEQEILLTCQTLPCTYDIILSNNTNPYQYVKELEGFAYSLNYDKTTKVVTLDYTNTDNNFYYLDFSTLKRSLASGDTEVCSETSYNDEDVLTCNVSAYNSGSFISYVNIRDTAGNTYTITYTFEMTNAPEIFGKEGLFWAIMIIVGMFLLFLFNPIAAIFGAIIAVVIVAIIGLAALPWLFIVLIATAGIIIIIKLKT